MKRRRKILVIFERIISLTFSGNSQSYNGIVTLYHALFYMAAFPRENIIPLTALMRTSGYTLSMERHIRIDISIIPLV